MLLYKKLLLMTFGTTLVYVGPRGGILFMSSFWRLEFSGGSYIFKEFVHPCLRDNRIATKPRNGYSNRPYFF